MLRRTKMRRGGSGNPWCKIRRCVRKRELTGCCECGEAGACKKLLRACRLNLDKMRRVGLKTFLAEV